MDILNYGKNIKMKAKCLKCYAKLAIFQKLPCYEGNWFENGAQCPWHECYKCGYSGKYSSFKDEENPVEYDNKVCKYICKKCEEKK